MTTIYKDIPLSFKANPATGDVKPYVGERAVHGALLNLLRTPIGTRPFDPEYGVGLDRYLFDIADQLTEMEINDTILDAINKHEKRVQVIAIESTFVENGIEVVIEYYVKGYSNQQTIQTVIGRA